MRTISTMTKWSARLKAGPVPRTKNNLSLLMIYYLWIVAYSMLHAHMLNMYLKHVSCCIQCVVNTN